MSVPSLCPSPSYALPKINIKKIIIRKCFSKAEQKGGPQRLRAALVMDEIPHLQEPLERKELGQKEKRTTPTATRSVVMKAEKNKAKKEKS